MTNLNQILFKINHGDGTIGKLVNNQEFYNNAKLSLQKLDKAADSLEDTGPLSVVGIMAGQIVLSVYKISADVQARPRFFRT